MKKFTYFFISFLIASTLMIAGNRKFDSDIIKTDNGDLLISFIGHGTLMFTYNKMTIHIDPYSQMADYSTLPKANLILLTHHHGDHLDLDAIKNIIQEDTTIISTQKCAEKLGQSIIMNNGEIKALLGLKIESVPAYNIQHKRENGVPFHIKGEGNGYIITFGNKRVYIAGDTENIPEMTNLKNIDVAFLPMNLPYTMTPEMVAEAAKIFKPAILYPYHYGTTDASKLVELLKNEKEIEVRIKKIYPTPPPSAKK